MALRKPHQAEKRQCLATVGYTVQSGVAQGREARRGWHRCLGPGGQQRARAQPLRAHRGGPALRPCPLGPRGVAPLLRARLCDNAADNLSERRRAPVATREDVAPLLAGAALFRSPGPAPGAPRDRAAQNFGATKVPFVLAGAFAAGQERGLPRRFPCAILISAYGRRITRVISRADGRADPIRQAMTR